MPEYQAVVEICCPVAEVFDFLARPANLVQLAPPELRLELVEGPPRLALGAVLRWKARRLGVSQSLVNEITAFEEGVRIEERQRQGPFRSWQLRQRFETRADGTRLVQELTYEPPGGLLGMLLGAEAVRREMAQLFAYRGERLQELLVR